MTDQKQAGFNIRPIRKEDDPFLAAVIRGCFHDYNATEEGTVYADPVIDRLSVSFNRKRSVYYVLEYNGEVLGGAGIQPLKGADGTVCELQKMYLRKDARGKGYGRLLLEKCLEYAKSNGFNCCYLESLPELKDALHLYERAGFSYIDHRLGNTGYYGCSLYMTIDL